MAGTVKPFVVLLRWRGLQVRLVRPRLQPLPTSRQQAMAMAYYWSAFALLNLADEAAMLAMMFC
jgi:hypothetical protein